MSLEQLSCKKFANEKKSKQQTTPLLLLAEDAVRVPISDVEAGGGAHAAVNRKCRLRLLVDAPLLLRPAKQQRSKS